MTVSAMPSDDRMEENDVEGQGRAEDEMVQRKRILQRILERQR